MGAIVNQGPLPWLNYLYINTGLSAGLVVGLFTLIEGLVEINLLA